MLRKSYLLIKDASFSFLFSFGPPFQLSFRTRFETCNFLNVEIWCQLHDVIFPPKSTNFEKKMKRWDLSKSWGVRLVSFIQININLITGNTNETIPTLSSPTWSDVPFDSQIVFLRWLIKEHFLVNCLFKPFFYTFYWPVYK